jgi:hypothetical protein
MRGNTKSSINIPRSWTLVFLGHSNIISHPTDPGDSETASDFGPSAMSLWPQGQTANAPILVSGLATQWTLHSSVIAIVDLNRDNLP